MKNRRIDNRETDYCSLKFLYEKTGWDTSPNNGRMSLSNTDQESEEKFGESQQSIKIQKRKICPQSIDSIHTERQRTSRYHSKQPRTTKTRILGKHLSHMGDI